MKNTLRFALLIIGSGLMGVGVYSLLFSDFSFGKAMVQDSSQSYAIIAFGVLCFLGGMAYKRK